MKLFEYRLQLILYHQHPLNKSNIENLIWSFLDFSLFLSIYSSVFLIYMYIENTIGYNFTKVLGSLMTITMNDNTCIYIYHNTVL